jgi:hypothetical protein
MAVSEVPAQCLTPEIYAAEISDPVQLALLRFASSARDTYDNDLKEQ